MKGLFGMGCGEFKKFLLSKGRNEVEIYGLDCILLKLIIKRKTTLWLWDLRLEINWGHKSKINRERRLFFLRKAFWIHYTEKKFSSQHVYERLKNRRHLLLMIWFDFEKNFQTKYVGNEFLKPKELIFCPEIKETL